MEALKVWPMDGVTGISVNEILADPDMAGNTMPCGAVLRVDNYARRPRIIRITHPDCGEVHATVAAAKKPLRGNAEPAAIMIGPVGLKIPGLEATDNIDVPVQISYPDGIKDLKVAVFGMCGLPAE